MINLSPFSRRILGGALLLAAVGVCTLPLVSRYWQSRDPALRSGHQVTGGAASRDRAASASAPPSKPSLMAGLDPSGDVTMPKDATPIAALPADLPLHPGAKKLLSFQRTDGAWTEQQGVWTISGLSPAAALDYYQQAAEQRGFTLLRAAANPAASRVLGRGGEQLLLRATAAPVTASAIPAAAPSAPPPAASGVRLTVIFRYTDSPTR